MASGKDALWMHHPNLSSAHDIRAVDEGQARVFELSGWVRGRSKAPKKATSKKEKPNG